MKKLAVVGLGYVGLPLALIASKKGYDVVGLEIDESKVLSLKKSKSYVDDVSDAELKASKAKFTSNFSELSDAEAIFICVPTPVNEDKTPNLGPVRGAVKEIAPYIKEHVLVILESTVNPGVCDETVIPLLEKLSGKKAGEYFYLAHCPERINPGDPKWNVSNINRVVGANSKVELDLAKSLYESIIDADIRPMGSLKEAEAVKVVENSFRDINIAFVNELAMSFSKIGIDVVNVINGAATKPFSFMAHYPSCGVGGHCIPVDPYYLIEYASEHGFDHEFLNLARNINEHMPRFTVQLLEDALNEVKLPLNGTRVTMLGLSYKANIGDDRESPSYDIKKLLRAGGADLVTFDPFMKAKSSVDSLDQALKNTKAVVIATGHKQFIDKLKPLALKKLGVKVFIDGQNKFKDLKSDFAKAGIVYKGIGV